MSINFRIKNNQGFTLIEVLITMIVLAIGLLGLAALQTTGLRNSLSAYNRSQATIFAYDLADRMRANSVETDNLMASVYNRVDPDNAVAQNNCVLVVGCSAAQMAQNDLFEWHRDISATLPLGEGSITGVLVGVNPNQNMIYTLTIIWDGNRDGNVNADDPNFKMTLQL